MDSALFQDALCLGQGGDGARGVGGGGDWLRVYKARRESSRKVGRGGGGGNTGG